MPSFPALCVRSGACAKLSLLRREEGWWFGVGAEVHGVAWPLWAGAAPRTRTHTQTQGHTPARWAVPGEAVGPLRARALEQTRPDQAPGSVTQHGVISDNSLYPSGLLLRERGAWFFYVVVLGEHLGVCGGTVGMDTHSVILEAPLHPSPTQEYGEKPTRPLPTMVAGGRCHSRSQ